MSKPLIFIVTGPSSGGKTTLAKAMQENLRDVFWRYSADDFISMLPIKHQQNEKMASKGILRAADMTVDSAIDGQNVIIDGVFEKSFALSLREAFAPVGDLKFIVVTAPYSVLEKRESARPNRNPEWLKQHKLFKFKKGVDLRLDSSRMSVEQSVQKIAKKFQLKLDV